MHPKIAGATRRMRAQPNTMLNVMHDKFTTRVCFSRARRRSRMARRGGKVRAKLTVSESLHEMEWLI